MFRHALESPPVAQRFPPRLLAARCNSAASADCCPSRIAPSTTRLAFFERPEIATQQLQRLFQILQRATRAVGGLTARVQGLNDLALFGHGLLGVCDMP